MVIIMLNFKQITLDDKENVKKYLALSGADTLEYSFTTLIIWQVHSKTMICEKGGLMYIMILGKNFRSFLMPFGRELKKEDVDPIFEYCRQNSCPVAFHSLTEEQKNILSLYYPGKFTFTENRDYGDYIYEAEKLRTLSGKKLNSKRNHINRFLAENPDWSYEPITKDNIDQAYKMNLEWKEQMKCYENSSLESEGCAVISAFKNFFDLGLDGGMLKAGGRVVAFSMGEALNESTYLVHIEKAFPDVNGAYPMINREFVIHNCDGFEFINREDDSGDEGLRKAKLSYKPYKIALKFDAKENK